MFRENWKALPFWRWWWRTHVPAPVKTGVLAAFVGLLLFGGYIASGGLTGANAAGNSSDAYILQTTVTKIVTLKEHGRTVVKRIPVVIRRSIVHAHTSYETVIDTRVVTTPGGVRYETRKVIRYVPVVKKRVVRVNGKTRTVTETRLVPTVQTETLTSVVTDEQTVTNQSTVLVHKTNTVTEPVTTVQTVTLPPDTVTQTETHTETVTETETVIQPVTSTETVTLTVTVDTSPLP